VRGGVGAENVDGGVREGGEATCGTTWRLAFAGEQAAVRRRGSRGGEG
jgi:hypothetical protein